MRALLMVHGYDVTTGAPDPIPDGWTVARIGGAEPWFAVTHPSGRRVHAWRENEGGPNALWAVFGAAEDLAALDAIVEESFPAREAWRRKGEATVKARLRYWRTLRCSGQRLGPEGMEPFILEAVVAVPRGARLPDWTSTPLPWNLDATGALVAPENATLIVESVAGVDTITLPITLAGHGYPSAFASEPDPGAP